MQNTERPSYNSEDVQKMEGPDINGFNIPFSYWQTNDLTTSFIEESKEHLFGTGRLRHYRFDVSKLNQNIGLIEHEGKFIPCYIKEETTTSKYRGRKHCQNIEMHSDAIDETEWGTEFEDQEIPQETTEDRIYKIHSKHLETNLYFQRIDTFNKFILREDNDQLFCKTNDLYIAPDHVISELFDLKGLYALEKL